MIRFKLIVTLVLALLAGMGARRVLAGPPPPYVEVGLDYPLVVNACPNNTNGLRTLGTWTEPWAIDRQTGCATIALTSPTDWERLLTAGFQVEIDAQLTTQLHTPNTRLPGQIAGIPAYPCYRTVEETFATAVQLTNDYPNLVEWIDIGDSWEKTRNPANGYNLMVLKLSNQTTPGPKPALFAVGSIHAREYAPAELLTRFAEYLLTGYGQDADLTWLLDEHEIHLLLQGNPDGRKKAETGTYWRKNTNSDYCAYPSNIGIDLNRNFPYQWGSQWGGSSGYPCDTNYRGPTAGSEPETQAITSYAASLFPDVRPDDSVSAAPLTTTGLFLDIHSYGGWVLWPWGYTPTDPPNAPQLQTLGRKLAYFNGYLPVQAYDLGYTTNGATDDFAYGTLGVAALTFEIGSAFFQDCNTFEQDILPDNLNALIYAAKAARLPYQRPAGPEVTQMATITAANQLTLTTILDDTRYEASGGIEASQPISAAGFTINQPPWRTPLQPMAPLDGAWDNTRETAVAVIATDALTPGRHTLYVQAQDAAGNLGVVRARFITVTANMTGTLPLTPTPGIVVQPAVISQTWPVANSGSAIITLTNQGSATLTWGTVSISPPHSTLSIQPLSGQLAVNQTQTTALSYQPQGTLPVAMILSGTVRLPSNDPQTPVVSLPFTLNLTTTPTISLTDRIYLPLVIKP